MANTNFTVSVALQLSGAQATQFMQRFAQVTKTAGANVKILQQNLASTNQTIARGVGSFFAMHQALRIATSFMREGIRAAVDQATALNRLAIVMNLTEEQTESFRIAAENVGASLGAFNTVNAIEAFEALSHVMGQSEYRMKAILPLFATVIDNLSLLAPGITAGQGIEVYTKILSQFGGIQHVGVAQRVLNATSSAIGAFSPKDPQRYLATLMPMASTARFANLSIENIAALAALATIAPVGGTRAGGRSVASILDTLSMIAIAPLGGKGKQKAFQQHLGAAKRLGLVTPGGLPTFIDQATGEFNFAALIGSLAQFGGDPKQRGSLQRDLKEVFGAELGRRFAKALALSPEFWTQVSTRIPQMLSAQEINRRGMTGSPMGGWQRLSSNWETVMGRMFWDPASLGGRAAYAGGGVLELLSHRMQRPGSGQMLSNTLAASGMFGSAAIATFIGAWMSRGVLSATTTAMIARVAGGAAMGGMLGLFLSTAILLFQNSQYFDKAVQELEHGFGTLYTELIGYLETNNPSWHAQIMKLLFGPGSIFDFSWLWSSQGDFMSRVDPAYRDYYQRMNPPVPGGGNVPPGSEYGHEAPRAGAKGAGTATARRAITKRTMQAVVAQAMQEVMHKEFLASPPRGAASARLPVYAR